MHAWLEGLPVSGPDDAVETLGQAVESYLGSRSDTARILKGALEREPDHLMARCMMGYLLKLAGDPANAARSAAVHRELAERVDRGAGTDWERGHVGALGLWLADDLEGTERRLEQLVDAYPRDLLALRILHYLYFYDGDARRMRDSVAARLPHWRGHPLEGYVRGMYAFGLEEAGDYGEAERQGRAAVEANPRDLWACHAVAHVMEMQRRPDAGLRWLAGLSSHWPAGNNFRFHLHWHEALFHLARGDLDQVLALYDSEIGRAVADDFYLDMCNAASLLLRLEAAGIDVGDRWQPLARLAADHVADRELAFASLHYLMPLLRTGHPGAEALLSSLEGWAAADTTQGRVVREVALDVAQGLVAREAGELRRSLALHGRVASRLHRVGGSHAQRAVFDVAADSARRQLETSIVQAAR